MLLPAPSRAGRYQARARLQAAPRDGIVGASPPVRAWRGAGFCSTSTTARKREEGFTTFLPATSVGGGQIFAQNPVVGVSQNVAFDALRVLDMLVQRGIIGPDPGCSDLGHKKFTPGHSRIPSLLRM